MWPFKRKCDCHGQLKELHAYILVVGEELAKHLANHESQKDIHKNCVSQDKVNQLIAGLKREIK